MGLGRNMVFNSVLFLVFFLIVTSGYWLLAHRYRWLWLLLASCYFYMAFVPIYILILAITIIIDYFAGILIEKSQKKTKKWYLILSLIANIGVLAIFKYYHFLDGNFQLVGEFLGTHWNLPTLDIILPIGLSFHTFQAMSYTIEVYRGNQKAERNLGIYSLYVMFYPQLVAGPIERPQNLLPQFYREQHWNTQRVQEGILQMLWGLFKKVVIADRLAILIDQVYGDISTKSKGELILATFLYSFQIYGDFSGYSDMAIGAAKIMGFDLMKNFNAPYLSKSIPEFWKRWHISLSTWFKDYVYISLGGNRVRLPIWYRNLMIVFILSGLWHGASWNFVIWGALHGIFQIISQLFKQYFPIISGEELTKKGLAWLAQGYTFILVSFAWVFFRLNSFSDIKIYFEKIFFTSNFHFGQLKLESIITSFGLCLVLFFLEKTKTDASFLKISHFWLKIISISLIIYFLGVFNSNQFIYFQF